MPRPVTAVGRAAAGTLFGTLARALGTRPLHPEGWAYEAELVVDEPRIRGARLFSVRKRRHAIVRFSKGFGLPEPMPDLMSMAIKVPDAYCCSWSTSTRAPARRSRRTPSRRASRSSTTTA